MRIRIIAGTYGFRPNGGSRVVPVSRGGTCEVPEDEAKRLVALGVAQYVTAEEVTTDDADVETGGAGMNTPGTKKPTAFTTDGVAIPGILDIVDGHFTAESLRQMTNPNLAKLGADLGIDVSKCKVKDDFISVLTDVELDFTVPENGEDADGEDDDAVEDGEDPPEFDGDSIVE